MYHLEKEINGDWYFKSSPNSKWIKFSREALLMKIKSLSRASANQLQTETF